ncbi:AMP-dependent synthetase/ligase [Nannocystaceae bacterium ST9]
MAKDILDLVEALVSSRPNASAVLHKRTGEYVSMTWAELWDQARAVARSLIAIGIAAGDRVDIVSNTRVEWLVLDLGILAAGAITVPIYPSNLADECRYVAKDAGARLVFCEDAGQVGKFVAVRDELPEVVKVVQMTGAVEAGDDEWVITMDSFLARGTEVDEGRLGERRAALGPESTMAIIYTSGTTGRPKGVVLSHANMLYEAEAIREVGLIEADDVQLLFLPLSHSFAKMLAVSWLATGHVLAIAESMATIKQNLGEVRPTVMAGVPRVFEKFYAAVVEKGMATPGAKGKLFARALGLSTRKGELEQKRQRLGPLAALEFVILRKLVLSKVGAAIQQTLGGRMRLMLSGGAPLGHKIAWFFRDAGIEIFEGYGLTETAAGTVVGRRGANQVGTVGVPLPGTEARIAADGEILLRGPGIMHEYWRDPVSTAEVLVDGWFHTGDIGELDPETGALRITDRKKDLIVTAGGKNVAPQKLENLVRADPLISQCVVHGDRRNFLTAIVTLDPAALAEFATHHGLAGSYTELCERAEVRAALERVFAEVNAELASYETIKKFAILSADFSIETGELTPKLSVKRKLVERKYAAVFDGLYAEPRMA